MTECGKTWRNSVQLLRTQALADLCIKQFKQRNSRKWPCQRKQNSCHQFDRFGVKEGSWVKNTNYAKQKAKNDSSFDQSTQETVWANQPDRKCSAPWENQHKHAIQPTAAYSAWTKELPWSCNRRSEPSLDLLLYCWVVHNHQRLRWWQFHHGSRDVMICCV